MLILSRYRMIIISIALISYNKEKLPQNYYDYIEKPRKMKKLTTGILAHVDAGKTTLSEGMLYKSGTLRKLGAVDKGTAYLDSDDLEKKRGITIFSHIARIQTGNSELQILDTPGDRKSTRLNSSHAT